MSFQFLEWFIQYTVQEYPGINTLLFQIKANFVELLYVLFPVQMSKWIMLNVVDIIEQ